jgi:uncharacterized RDD family membrane protein YckC
MHAGERDRPIMNPEEQPAQSAAEQEAWRSLVASRVSSYRAKRRRNGQELPPALDFGPAPDSSARKPMEQPAAEAATDSRGERPWRPIESALPAARKPFDTDYYRRMNAESFDPAPLAHGSSALAEAAPDPVVPESMPSAESAAQESSEVPDLELRSAPAGDAALDRYLISAPATEPEAESAPAPRAAEKSAAAPDNLIVFRRPLIEPPLVPPPVHDELAEPMHSRPRILEVPEDIMPPVQGSLFPEIQLDGDPDAPDARETAPKMPMAVAMVTERLAAGLVDLGIVLAGGAIFAGMAFHALPDVPHTKPFFMALAAVTVLFWAFYQHLFLLYAGRTPGMALKGIRLSTFEGQPPAWEERFSRARFMFFSMASMLLGFVWALVDEDMLCWHDRISRTFPTAS